MRWVMVIGLLQTAVDWQNCHLFGPLSGLTNHPTLERTIVVAVPFPFITLQITASSIVNFDYITAFLSVSNRRNCWTQDQKSSAL